jgi:hypothetical protein
MRAHKTRSQPWGTRLLVGGGSERCEPDVGCSRRLPTQEMVAMATIWLASLGSYCNPRP